MSKHIVFDVLVSEVISDIKNTHSLATFHFYGNEFDFSFKLGSEIEIDIFSAEFKNQKFYVNNIFNAAAFNSYLVNLKESSHMKNYTVLYNEV